MPAALAAPTPETVAAKPARPNFTGLPDALKAGIESLSGLSMDDGRVHHNSSQPAQLNALAYAQGSAIHLAPGHAGHCSSQRRCCCCGITRPLPIKFPGARDQDTSRVGGQAAPADPTG